MRKISLTSLALLLLGVILNSCSKDSNGGGDDPNNPAGQGGGADDQYKIVFTTDKAIGEEITFDYSSAFEDEEGLWVDFNNNGIRESGEFGTQDSSGEVKGIVGSQTITVYGKVTVLAFRTDQKITTIDTSKDIYLKELRVRDNPIETLDVTHNPNLEKLYVHYPLFNQYKRDVVDTIGLKSFYFSADKNPKLGQLKIYARGMETLDISNFPELYYLSLEGSIENVEIKNNPNVDFNSTFGWRIKIKNLKIKNNAKANSFKIDAALIESIDVSNNSNLEYLGIFTSEDVNKNLKKVNLVNTPKLKIFNIIVSSGMDPYDLSFCVQVDADRVNNLPKDWSKTSYDKDFKQQTTINYSSTSCP